VTSAGFPAFGSDRPYNVPSTDHVESAGVLISTDGGASWAVASSGLAVGGVPYRHVQRLVVSPTYATDGTLFAFAWGPRQPGPFMGGVARDWRAALFRSRDRGAAWEPVRVRGPSFARGSVALALSPTFASDGVAVLGENSAGLSPASSTCTVLRSGDSGTGWEQVVRPGSYEGCGSAYFVAQGGGRVAIIRKGPGWLRSLDDGRTWGGFSPPEGTIQSVAVPGTTTGLVLVGTTAGAVWAFGP
jgi:hypothetical protein